LEADVGSDLVSVDDRPGPLELKGVDVERVALVADLGMVDGPATVRVTTTW
jgi:hypothetical protein